MNELSASEANANTFASELAWLDRLIRFREYNWLNEKQRRQAGTVMPELETNAYYAEIKTTGSIAKLDAALPPKEESPYAGFLHHYEFGMNERAALLLALLPHLAPGTIEMYAARFNCVEFGGKKQESGVWFPTFQTLFFILGGTDLQALSGLYELLHPDHICYRHRLLKNESQGKNAPLNTRLLLAEQELTDQFLLGYVRPPDYNSDFPAKRITTEMDWDDLVLAAITRRQVEEIKIWLRHRERLMGEFGMAKRLKPGYKALFYGAPGTGKTLTAQLLGKYIGKDVFRIDLSTIVSKYIGETEKNLAKVFDKAEHADWILFFDEADALFGKRTNTSNAHDRYANQQVAYLLQRIEDFPGIVILASNMKSNIDDAFMRRFQSAVHFPFPKPDERQQLWKKAFPEKLNFSAEVDLRKISDKYEMSGAHITNIAAWCALMAMEKNDYIITESMIREGMARELAKEGRTL